MKRFINREKERAFLEKEYAKSTASLVVIYGRRRIGKTALIKEFLKDKSALFFLATEESESENRNAFRQLVSEYVGDDLIASSNIGDWESLFRFILEKGND